MVILIVSVAVVLGILQLAFSTKVSRFSLIMLGFNTSLLMVYILKIIAE